MTKKPDVTKFLSNNFAYNLQILRKNKAVSQVQMAKHLGIGRTTYASYEYGRSEPNIATLLAFSEYFEVSINDMCLKDLLNEEIVKSDKKELNVEKTNTSTKSGDYSDLENKVLKQEAKIQVLEEFIKESIQTMMKNVTIKESNKKETE